MAAADFETLNASRTEAVRGLRGGLADHLVIDLVQVDIAETSPDILTGAAARGLGVNASASAHARALSAGALFPPRPGDEDTDALPGIAESAAEFGRHQHAMRGRFLSQVAMTVDYELFGPPQAIPGLQARLQETQTDPTLTAAFVSAVVASLAAEGLSVSLLVFVREIMVLATTPAPPTTTTTTTLEDFFAVAEELVQEKVEEQLQAIASGARIFFAGLGVMSVLVLAFYGGFRWRAIWKSAPISPTERESTAWADNGTPAETQTQDQEENALMLANQRLQSQIDRVEAWRGEQEERQRRAEEAAKARCEQLLDANRALSEEVRSLRESTAASPDLTTNPSPEPPADLPSGVFPASPGAGNFATLALQKSLLKRELTKAFGKERAAAIRQRSEAVAELYFGDV